MRSLTKILLCAWVLLWATAAEADCGWVVWIEHSMFGDMADNKIHETKWELRAAYETKAQCDMAMTMFADGSFKLMQPTPDSPGIDRTIWIAPHYALRTFYKTRDGRPLDGSRTQSFQCFPGTIDPSKAGNYR